MRNIPAIIFFVVLLTSLGGSLGFAQGTADIVGTVKDGSGAVLPGVALTVTNRASGQTRQLMTDEQGNYVVTALPIGEYVIRAEIASFRPQVREGVVLQVGDRPRVDMTLELGDVTQEITVQESVPLLRTTSAEVSEVINNQRLVDLPLNGRQFVQLTLLSDNVFLTPVGTRGAALAQTGRQVVVGGQRVGHNMYWFDGTSITDQYFNNLVISPSVEAIQEFKIQKSIYSAEFGGKASANINAATKAGTNTFHGAAYEFFRNDIFDARTFFDRTPDPPPLRQNQFGVSVGGPIRQDKTFFFTNYEGFRERRSQSRVFSLPSAKVRSGDFSGLPAIYDPLSTNASGQRQAFENNKIPAERLNPVALSFLRNIPLPNLPGETGNYIVSSPFTNDHDQFTLRGDEYFGQNDTLFGRFTFANMRTFQPYGNTNLQETLVPGFGYDITTKTSNAAVNYTHIFSPSVIHELRLGYLRAVGGQESENIGTDFAGQSGLQGVTRDLSKAGYPTFNFSDAYTTMGDPQTLVTRRNNSFDLFSTLSWIRGAHSMKFGGYIYRLHFNPRNSPNARGSFIYTPRFSSSAAGLGNGNGFADFLLGYPSTATVGIGRGEMDGRTTWAHLFAQDDWQIRPTLTLNLGLRWELNTQMGEAQNRLSNIELNRFVIASEDGKIHPDAQALLPFIPVPYVTSEEAGYENTLQRPVYRRYAPRVGIAWSPSQKTVVRTGFGLFYNQAAYSINEILAQNLPFYFNKTITTASDLRVPTLSTDNILLTNPTGSIGGGSLQYDYRSEYAESWTFSIQRELTPNWALLVTYFGSHIVGADDSTISNVPLPGPGSIDPRRPNPNLSGFRTIHWGGWSKYHSFAMKLEKRLSNGLAFDANWTWSKAMDVASDPGPTFHEFNIPQNVYDRRPEEALSSFDHRHRLTFTYSYDLPFGMGHGFNPSGFVGNLVNGWTLSGIGTFQIGAPITANLAADYANIGSGPAQRPDLLRDPNLPSGKGTAEQWFDTGAFALPGVATTGAPVPFQFGNAGRNIIYEAGEAQVDLSIMKNTSVSETTRIEFRAEMFNIFNRVNFVGAPGRLFGSANFGRLFNTGPSRQMQLGLKYVF